MPPTPQTGSVPITEFPPSGQALLGCRAFAKAGLILFGMVLASCDLPRDVDGTLDRVQGGELRVGVTENPPWTRIAGGAATGVEAALVRDFAASVDAKVTWVAGAEHALLRALAAHQLDVVIGGLTDDMPHYRGVATTQPYFESRIVVALPVGTAAIASAEGEAIAFPPDEPELAADIAANGGSPVPASVDDAEMLPIAIQRWRRGVWPPGNEPLELARHRHVIAVAGGENGFLFQLEAFLAVQKGRVEALLQDATR